MVYKNTIKDYVLSATVFGVPMGLLFGVMYFSIILGVICGIACVLFFGLFVFFFSKAMERKFGRLREKISAERHITCDGAATLNGNGGWMYFTEYGLEFYPHKINLNTNSVALPTASIKATAVEKNRLTVVTDIYGTFIFIVVKPKEWQKHIDAAIPNAAFEP